MSNIKEANDNIIKDYRSTPAAKGIKIVTMILTVVYIAILVYFLFFHKAGLFPWEYALILCFAGVPVFFSIFCFIMPYREYDKMKKNMTTQQHEDFLREYERSKAQMQTSDGIITQDRIVFLMGMIGVPELKSIVWTYLSPMPGTGRDNIIFLTDNRKFYISVVLSGDSNKVFERYLYYIKEHNPDCMVGDTKENDAMYAEKYEKKKRK